jgi:ADP-ribosyl-[dinitrogen reductase] hydrolase
LLYVYCCAWSTRTGMVVGVLSLVRHGPNGSASAERCELSLSYDVVREGEKIHDVRITADRCSASHGSGLARNSSKRTKASRSSPLTESINRSDAGSVRDRLRGALIGLAVGDAVGTSAEFKPRGSFTPVTNMVGGGPFGLLPGQWTDDTSMALCLAESLIECGRFDARDQMERYVRWWRHGHLSSTGRCFDIGNTVRTALSAFERTGDPFSGPVAEHTAGNGSLMRLAPIPIFYFGSDEDAIAFAAESSRTTHGAPVAVDACRYLAALIEGALSGVTKEELLAARYSARPGYWDHTPLDPVIDEIAYGSFERKSTAEIRGSGYAAESLEAALWAFHHSTDYQEGCLLAVNLGDDADTTAAIYGQLAGAYYGESGIPHEWRDKLAHKQRIDRFADDLIRT